MAGVLILEPIFEADLQDEQYAYRAKRNAHDAVREVHRWLNRGLKEVVIFLRKRGLGSCFLVEVNSLTAALKALW